MRTAICPGSFDPITLGHLNIIRRAAAIFDRVVVCVTINSEKTSPMFTNEEKVDMVRRAVIRYPNVSVDTCDVLLADFVPQIIQEIRYYSTYNFIGDRIDGYEEPLAFLTREAAAALKEVSD